MHKTYYDDARRHLDDACDDCGSLHLDETDVDSDQSLCDGHGRACGA